MKLKHLNSYVLAITVFIVFGCSDPILNKPEIIHTKGIANVFNLSKSHTLFGSLCLDDTISGLALEDSDLLYVLHDESPGPIMFQYSPEYGKNLIFHSDTLEPFKISLNNRLFSVQPQDSSSWIWIKDQNTEIFSSLHSISLSLPLAEDEMKILSGLAENKKDLNLMIEAENNVKQLEKILAMFHPSWLYFSGNDSFIISDDILDNLSNLNTLGINIGPDAYKNINQFYRLSHLSNLILEWNPETGPEIDFLKFKNLSSLSLNNSSLKSTAGIRLPVNTRNLFFTSCDSLTDISSLADYAKLQTLGFSGCKKLQNIAVVKGMKNLTWLSCPPSIDQSQFDTLISSLPSLQVLELINCDSLRNLDILKKVKGLKSLVLASENIDISALFELKSLELLVIKPDTSLAGKNNIQELTAKLPHTMVVPGGGLCLGSGWILLIIPVVLIGLFAFKGKRVQS